jgi:tetratricopeptide (TPR) repeat protein
MSLFLPHKNLSYFFSRSTWLPIGLIAAVALAIYGPFLHSPLVFDDVNVLDDAILSRYGSTLFRLELRWLPYASFEWTRALFGPDLVWQRLGNLALHLANGAVLFLFLRRLFDACLSTAALSLHQRTPQDASSFAWLAFAGAAIFVLHPAAVYGAAYLVQRTILMASLFTLLMWWLLLEGMLRERQSWLLASALSYGLAVFSKEHAIMAPAVAAALVVLVAEPRLQNFKRLLPAFSLYAIIGAFVIYQVMRGQIFGNAYEPRAVDYLQVFANAHSDFDPSLAHPLSVLTQATLFFKYLLIWIVPNPLWMSIDMAESFAVRLVSWPETAGFVGFIAYFVVALRLLLRRGYRGLLGFAMLGPWLMFATEFSTVRIQESFVIYRSYLWMPALTAGLPLLFRTVPPVRAAALLLILAGVMLPVTWNRLVTFSDELLLWNDAARLSTQYGNRPGVERIFLNRGIAFYERGYHAEAIRDMEQALAIRPRYIEAFTTRGAAWLALDELDRALQDFNAASRLNPQYFQPYLGRGRVHELRNELDAARTNYRAGCQLGSNDACQAFKRISL